MEKQKAEVGKLYRTSFVPQLRAIDEKARTIEFVASTEAVDRYGDIIRVSGWKLDAYKQNPVFLWAHKSGEPPIGKTVGIHVETNPPALVQKVEFADKETYPFADTIFNLYKGKYMRAVSVGFMPLEMPNRITDLEGNATGGYEFTSQELLELSACPVGANPEALARAVQKGFSETDLQRVFSAPPMTEVEVYRELAAVNHEIARVAVAFAKETLLKADELRVLLKAAQLRGVNLTADLTLAEVLAAIRGSGVAAEEIETLEAETGSSEITTLDQLAAAVGTSDGDETPSLDEVFSDSRSLRTGKFKFAVRPGLR